MTFTVDGAFRYESFHIHRPIALPESVDSMLGRSLPEVVGKKIAHAFANAVQAAIDGKARDLRYTIPIDGERWRSMARVNVAAGAKGFTAHVIRLGTAGLSAIGIL